jgi:hypothetical protein
MRAAAARSADVAVLPLPVAVVGAGAGAGVGASSSPGFNRAAVGSLAGAGAAAVVGAGVGADAADPVDDRRASRRFGPFGVPGEGAFGSGLDGSFAAWVLAFTSVGAGAAGVLSHPANATATTAPTRQAARKPNPMLEMDLWAMGSAHYDDRRLKDSRGV